MVLRSLLDTKTYAGNKLNSAKSVNNVCVHVTGVKRRNYVGNGAGFLNKLSSALSGRSGVESENATAAGPSGISVRFDLYCSNVCIICN